MVGTTDFFLSFWTCRYKNQDLLPGDLLFFRSYGLPTLFSNFISSITESYSGSIYHVAMITEITIDNITIIAAIPKKGVILSSYSNICQIERFFTEIEVSRVDIEKNITANVVEIANKFVGEAYNDIFSPDFINSEGKHSFYCSQLIQYVFNLASGIEIFPHHPMRFSGQDGKTLAYWEEYYRNLNIAEVPEGVNGTHPGSLYNSDFLINI